MKKDICEYKDDLLTTFHNYNLTLTRIRNNFQTIDDIDDIIYVSIYIRNRSSDTTAPLHRHHKISMPVVNLKRLCSATTHRSVNYLEQNNRHHELFEHYGQFCIDYEANEK
jgi:hypothetical protein